MAIFAGTNINFVDWPKLNVYIYISFMHRELPTLYRIRVQLATVTFSVIHQITEKCTCKIIIVTSHKNGQLFTMYIVHGPSL